MSSTENKLVRDEPATDSKVHNLSSILEASDESLSSTLTSFEAPGTPCTPAVPENRQHNQKVGIDATIISLQV